MISRSDWEPLPTPTLSPFARGYLSLCRFFTAAVWCVPALRVALVHSLINHFRQAAVWCVPALRVPLVHSLINHFRQKDAAPADSV